MMKKTPILLLVMLPVLLAAQERLSGLQYNHAVGFAQKQALTIKNHSIHRAAVALPFIDDFSGHGALPNTSLWMDEDVYVNNGFCKWPPTVGVATFDALNDTGAVYPGASSFPFIADFLTSQFVDLSAFTPSDSLYLSFYYQPQGRGNAPDPEDSLVLEFLVEYRADTFIDTTVAPYDTTFTDKWQRMWSSSGMPVDTFIKINHNRNFALVMVPLSQQVWFRNDFRFRFYNYASLASSNIPSWRSNCDQWNLDYVYLNAGRTMGDTLFGDMTFVNDAPCFLRNYQEMPYRQFAVSPDAEMRDSVHMYISNLGMDTLICQYRFNVKDESGTVIHSYDGGNWNLKPYYLTGYQNYNAHAWPEFSGFKFPVGNDSAEYLITHSIERIGTSQELNKQNDTVRRIQNFYNYYAYDDGAAEFGYGLEPKGAMLAYRFRLSAPDTLRGAQIFFNHVIDNANQRNFYLCAWADQDGKPGEIIYRNQKFLKPRYGSSMNGFNYYLFDSESPLILDQNNLTFYIGWIQQTSDNLNVGFDANNDASDKIYYNTEGMWENSSFSGSLLIRPMLGPEVHPDGSKIVKPEQSTLSVYPNPTNGRFWLVLPTPPPMPSGVSRDYEISIYTLTGGRILTMPYQHSFDLSWMRPGLYILQLSTTDHYLNYQTRLVISK